MYGYWTRPSVEPTVYGQAMQQSELYDPTTTAVAKAYMGEATVGVGTGYADYQAIKAQEAERKGVKISEDEYKNNPDLFSQGIQWHEGMTDESAKVLKEFNDAAVKRQKIISDASTGQSIAGFTAGFAAGIVEPKNLAIGVTASVATGGLAEIGVLGNTMRRLYQTRKAALRSRVAIGAAEGVGAGVAVEPSNRYSAKTLQQDYTMADSLFNIATSTAFGAGLPAATYTAGKAGPFMQAKIDKFRGRAMDVVTAETDIATQQLINSQRVDVSAVEAAEAPEHPLIKGLTEDEFIKKHKTGWIESRAYKDYEAPGGMGWLGSKDKFGVLVATEDFGGTKVEFRQTGEELKYVKHDANDNIVRDVNGDAEYLTPIEVMNKGLARTDKTIAAFVNDKPIGAVSDEFGAVGIFLEGEYQRKGIGTNLLRRYMEAHPKSKIGQMTDSGEALTRNLYRELSGQKQKNATTIQKHNAATLDHKNDTLIDYDAIDAADERRATQQVEGEAEAEAYLKEAGVEIQRMLDQEILNEADLEEYQKALQELKDANTKDALETLHLCMTRG